MPSKRFHVTDTELLVLQVLWEHGQATTREVCNEIYPEGSTSQYYTVQKLLERLESRSCVNRDRSQRVHQFSAAVDRETLIQERLRGLSDSLCNGSVLPMLSGLIQMHRWTAAEQKQLNKLIDEVSRKNAKVKKK